MTCVSRLQAEEFCAWIGRRLPSREEYDAALLARPTEFGCSSTQTWNWVQFGHPDPSIALRCRPGSSFPDVERAECHAGFSGEQLADLGFRCAE